MLNLIIQLFQNSNTSGLIALSSCIILYLITTIFFLTKALRIIHLYIFDNGNAGIPSLFCQILIYLITWFFIIFMLLKGDINAIVPLLIIVVYISLISTVLRSRIIGFPSVNIKHSIKFIMLVISELFAISSIILLIALYDPEIGIDFTGYTFYNISYGAFSSLVCTLTPSIAMPIIVILFSMIDIFMILYFDKKEKRRKIIIQRDILLFIPSVIYFIFGIFQKQLFFLTYTIIPVVLFCGINLIMFMHLKFEVNTTILKISKTDLTLHNINNLINKIINENNTNNNNSVRFKQIYNCIKENDEVRKNIFNKFTLNKRKKKLIYRLKETWAKEN